ncbi:hypothetical protein [Nonomuraea typhae]|uniref:hypothetical protein n=1 Tax=Nonomuraea typhae TaxID=2603600 RepID=UPI0012FC06D5|nr:hypothetical protein [Nonomuraea typhae]
MARVRFGISPIVPTIASFLLAALWGLSVFAGWGTAAFCGNGSAECGQRLAAVAGLSGLFAMLAAVCTAAAWVIPAARRDQRTFNVYMGSAVAAWIVAEGVLFLGGLLAT